MSASTTSLGPKKTLALPKITRPEHQKQAEVLRENVSLIQRIVEVNKKEGELHPKNIMTNQKVSERPLQHTYKKYNSLQALMGYRQQKELGTNSLNINRRVDTIVKTLSDNLQTYAKLSKVRSTLEHSQYANRNEDLEKIKRNLS